LVVYPKPDLRLGLHNSEGIPIHHAEEFLCGR